VSCRKDVDHEVKLAAAIALSRVGDDDARQALADEIVALSQDQESDRRVLSARMMGECEAGKWIDRSPLKRLLEDPVHDVVNAAFAAVRWPGDAELLVEVMLHLDDRRTASAAVDTLARGGAAALVLADKGLSGGVGIGPQGQVLLARVCRLIGDHDAAAVLRRHLDHDNREVGLAVIAALAALGPNVTQGEREVGHENDDTVTNDALASTLVRIDLEQAVHVLRALVALDDMPSAHALRAALADELTLLRRRLLAALSVRYGAEGMSRAAFQLAQPSTRAHALALEWLDVTLTGADRDAITLLDPGLTTQAQLRMLSRSIPVPAASAAAIVEELIADYDSRWRRPWIAACAVLAACDLPEVDFDALCDEITERASHSSPNSEAAILHETVAAIRQRQSV
jgi:HEAT repeat protein